MSALRLGLLSRIALGLTLAGVVPVAVNTLLTADDYAYMLRHSRAQAALVSAARLPALHDLPAELTTEAYAHLQSLLGPRPGRQPACLDQIAAWRGSMDDDLLAYVAAARSADC